MSKFETIELQVGRQGRVVIPAALRQLWQIRSGDTLLARLEELHAHPTVGDVRGLGLFAGVELVADRKTKKKFAKDSGFIKRVNRELLDRGLITRLWDVIHVAPPLVVSKEEIDQIVAGIDESLTIGETEFASEISG